MTKLIGDTLYGKEWRYMTYKGPFINNVVHLKGVGMGQKMILGDIRESVKR